MKVEVKEAEGLKRELEVELAPEQVQAAMDKQFGELRKKVTLKGFRKGKAPLNVIKDLYGAQVKMDVVDDLIKESYPKAIQENTLKVATRPEVTDLDFTDDGGLKYTARVEVFPEIDKVDYSGLKVQTAEAEASDEEVDEVVEQYRKQSANDRTVEREAREGDVVICDLKKLEDTKDALPQDEFPNSQVDLGNKMTVKEFLEELPGMKAGDEKEITVTYDDDYSDPKFAGAKIKYHCTVKEVKERNLPAFDDAFAKQTGQAETALELKMQIRENIKKHKQDNERRAQRQEIVQQVCEKNDVPIPEGLLEEYLDSVVEDLKKQSPEQEIDEKQAREHYRQVGINSMRWDMLWHTLADQEGIQVSPEDTEKWIKEFADSNNMTPDQAKDALRQSGKVQQLHESMREEKVLDFLIEKAEKVAVTK